MCRAAMKAVGDTTGTVEGCLNERWGPIKAGGEHCRHNVPALSVMIARYQQSGLHVKGLAKIHRKKRPWQFPPGHSRTFLFRRLACDKISETFRAEIDRSATLPLP